MVAVIGAATGAWAQTDDPEAELKRVRARASALARQVDTLRADDAELRAALAELNGQVAEQRARLDVAAAAADQAAETAAATAAAEEAAAKVLAEVEQRLAELAVRSYMNDPRSNALRALAAEDTNEALLRRGLLKSRAEREQELIAEHRAAKQKLAQRRQEASAAAEAAQDRRLDAEGEFNRLEEARVDQQRVAEAGQERLDRALGEAAVLAEQDEALAIEVAARQAALLEALAEAARENAAREAQRRAAAARTSPTPAGPGTVRNPIPVRDQPTRPGPTIVPRSDGPGPSPGAGGSDDRTPGGSSGGGAAPAPAPDPNDPNLAPPPIPVLPAVQTRVVRGIRVNVDIADSVDALMGAAAAAGFTLSGWGYRDTQTQINLRRSHCGDTVYDIYYRPSGECSPPTARPGRSRHELGLAIDFTYGGKVIPSQDTPVFQWLAANAPLYGLHNLPSEPWHWSDTGG
ncbi:MAG: D-alanyl-D-alanine carboxypeptidase family protein [Acidimicrobiales bacterium]